MTFCLRIGRVKINVDLEKKDDNLLIEEKNILQNEKINEVLEERRNIEEKHNLNNYYY
ncbi:hypothetical protein [Anaeromicrobium sediminis]|uniref:hypothetical protein n=1 Tax=Anaeromicrobium sediminis TaxID=1478221 RepID=UPI0015956B9C|nr:hypothetical protein [Anaeromicrobium sediminis]